MEIRPLQKADDRLAVSDLGGKLEIRLPRHRPARLLGPHLSGPLSRNPGPGRLGHPRLSGRGTVYWNRQRLPIPLERLGGIRGTGFPLFAAGIYGPGLWQAIAGGGGKAAGEARLSGCASLGPGGQPQSPALLRNSQVCRLRRLYGGRNRRKASPGDLIPSFCQRIRRPAQSAGHRKRPRVLLNAGPLPIFQRDVPVERKSRKLPDILTAMTAAAGGAVPAAMAALPVLLPQGADRKRHHGSQGEKHCQVPKNHRHNIPPQNAFPLLLSWSRKLPIPKVR